jgi:hypothetical protein
MSAVNPYITTDKGKLLTLKTMFRKYVTSESKRRTDISNITFKDNDKYIIDNQEFKLSWNSIKILIYNPTHLFLLENFEKFRKAFVDSLIYIVIQDIPDCDNNGVRFNKCTSIALGTSSITSDYDINLLSDNPMINSKIIKNFDKLFLQFFGNNSSFVFDTNIYGIGFLNKKKYIIPIQVRVQSIIAFVKLIHINEKYNTNSLKEFDIKNKYFGSMYREAKEFYTSRIKEGNGNLYLETLRKIQDVLGKNNDLSIIEYLSLADQEKIQSLISLANMYANETYFTQGAFLHVVSRLQSDESIDLSDSDYINSMFENFFEINKEYYIYINSLDVNLFLKSSYKYLFRFYDAAKEADLSINPELYYILKDLDRFRKGNQDNIDVQRKLSTLQDSLDILIDKDINITKNRCIGKFANINLLTDETCVNSEIKEYMICFWRIFLKLYNESLLVLPSPKNSYISLDFKSIGRRNSSNTVSIHREKPVITKSAESLFNGKRINE